MVRTYMASDAVNHSDLLAMIQKLDTKEQLRLLEELAIMVNNGVGKSKHSILELRGLGKDIWASIDAQEYVNREREAWSG